MKKNGMLRQIAELLGRATEAEARAILIILLNMQEKADGQKRA